MMRYVAFLRGVSPMNAKMAELRRSFESAGFADVKTVLSSGNVAFSACAGSETELARRAEAAMAERLGHAFYAIVRSTSALRRLIEADPYASFRLPADAKRVVTFMRDPRKAALSLPPASRGVRFLSTNGREIFTAYVPNPRGPIFMTMIEKSFGSDVTTRTWETVKKCAEA